MPPRCTLCTSPHRDEIDAALVEGRLPLRNIAERFGTSAPTLLRHKEHVPGRLALAKRAEEEGKAEDLLEKLRRLEADLRRLLAKAEKDGDYRAAIAAIRMSLDVVDLARRAEAERLAAEQDRIQRILDSPEWIEIRETLTATLEVFPGALEAVGLAMKRLEESDQKPRTATAAPRRTY